MRLFKISVRQHVIEDVLEEYESRFDKIFDGKNRIIIAMENDWVRDLVSKLREGKTKTGTKYEVDANLDYAWKATSGKAKNPTKIGRIIAFELGQENLTQWSRQKADMTKEEQLSIVISRSPVDIVRMSDWEGLTSCHAPGGEYFHCAIEEATSGGAIAFLVKTEDIAGITEDQLQDEDLFFDKDRKVGEKIKPVSRLRINRYVHSEDDGDELAIPMDAMYGRQTYPFFTNVKRFMLDQQKEKVAELINNKAELKKYIRVGGSYRDMNDSAMMKDFFDQDMGIRGNLESKHRLDIQRQQWEDEISQTVERFENLLDENITAQIYADIDDDDEHGELRISAGAIIKFQIDQMFNKNSELFKEFDIDKVSDLNIDLEFYSRSSSLSCLFAKSFGNKIKTILSQPFNQGGNVRFEEYEPVTDGFEVSLRWYFEDVNNPDDFSSECTSLADTLNNRYHIMHRAINESLTELNVIAPLSIRGAQLNERQLEILDSNLDRHLPLCDLPIPMLKGGSDENRQKDWAKKRQLIYREKEITDIMYTIMDSALSAAMRENRNPKNQTTFNFYEQTKSATLPDTLPVYWLSFVNQNGTYKIKKASRNPNSWHESQYLSKYMDVNEGKVALFIPYSEAYSQGVEYFLHIFSKLEKIQGLFTQRLSQELSRIYAECMDERVGPPQTKLTLPPTQRQEPEVDTEQESPQEQPEETPEEVKAGTWYNLYKNANV